MAWRYPESRIATGDVVTPHELMRNIDAVASEMNGHIDRDNLALATVDTDALASGACNSARFVEIASTYTLSVQDNWQVLSTLSTNIVCEDGWLQTSVSLAMGVVSTPEIVDQVLVAISVDGVIVGAEEGSNGAFVVYVIGDTPVSAGSKYIEVLVKRSPYETAGHTSYGITISQACLEARNVRR